jgi:hypothetical protein
MFRTLNALVTTLLSILFAAPAAAQPALGAETLAAAHTDDTPDLTDVLEPVSMGIPVPRATDTVAVAPAYDIDDEETMVDMRVIAELRRTLNLAA